MTRISSEISRSNYLKIMGDILILQEFFKANSCKVFISITTSIDFYNVYIKWGEHGSLKYEILYKHLLMHPEDKRRTVNLISEMLTSCSQVSYKSNPSDDELFDEFVLLTKKYKQTISGFEVVNKWVEIEISPSDNFTITLKISKKSDKLKDLYIFEYDDDKELIYNNITDIDAGYIRWK